MGASCSARRPPRGGSREARRRSACTLGALFAALAACGGSTPPEVPHLPPPAGLDEAPSCAGPVDAAHPLPGIGQEELTLPYWLAASERAGLDLDEPLLDARQIDAHRLAGDDAALPFTRSALAVEPRRAEVERAVRERHTVLRERLERGLYVRDDGTTPDAETMAVLDGTAPTGALVHRVTTEPVLLRCGPLAMPLRSAPAAGAELDRSFDRNACSMVERQELVQVLGGEESGMFLVRTRYALGWLDAAAAATLSPALDDPSLVRAWSSGPRGRARTSLRVVSSEATIELTPDVLVPIDPADERRVLFATTSGVRRSEPLDAGSLEHTRRPLTRRAFLTEAFRHLGEPYGWGGTGGGLDCSELVMDVLSTFDLDLPRHSADQAEAGSFSLAIPQDLPDEARLTLLDRALEQGVVLAHFPGHILIYLGRGADGAPRALHAFAEYLEPCAHGEAEPAAERLVRVNRVAVSDLELGRGTSRRAFIERLTRIVVLGPPPEGSLGVDITTREAAPFVPPAPEGACDDSMDTRIVVSPARPFAGHPLRVMVTARTRHGAARLQLIAPDGTRLSPTSHRLGGPPYAEWVEVAEPAAGRWAVGFADGPDVAACERFTVARRRPPPEPRRGDPRAAVWEPRWRWEADTEALYAAFVEQLFDAPIGDERTWSSLTELLRDPARNLLFDHLALGEDAAPDPEPGSGEHRGLLLEPDCADLPYFLRAYFAWKLRLPFAFRRCSRGRAGTPPTCGEPITNATPHEFAHEVDAFSWFATRVVGRGVHSASGRTAPGDELTDLYPVPLTRDALRPGTVFADPYGHLLVLVRWVPPSLDARGAPVGGLLLGADAQPDGTIGRRTFWRGTFLFTPDTRDAGAGFKAFRPIVHDPREDTYLAVANGEIGRAGLVPFGLDQYRGSADDFYDAMEALIDPRPLDPETRLEALVDALLESAVRRAVSVENGEAHARAHPGEWIAMPEGAEIFLTEGAWEDYSTPSRDLRLLIAIDTVMSFAEAVRRRPARFSWPAGTARDEVLVGLSARRDALLEARRFSYRRSDGSTAELRLTELVARAEALELGWNPNDCPELRWGAPEGSEEASTCTRRAPSGQRRAMEVMRPWFHERRRPLR
jgi:hypothetical protein